MVKIPIELLYAIHLCIELKTQRNIIVLKFLLYRVSQLKRNTFQWFIVLRLEGKYLCI